MHAMSGWHTATSAFCNSLRVIVHMQWFVIFYKIWDKKFSEHICRNYCVCYRYFMWIFSQSRLPQTSCCKHMFKMSLLQFFLISVKKNIFSCYSHIFCLYLTKKCPDNKLFLVYRGKNINICAFMKYHLLYVRIIPSVINWKTFFSKLTLW